jgi:Tol biopolymer transport system component
VSLSRGTQLGSYEIVSLLGVGGMGEVYRARDTRLGRVVAIKTLAHDLTVGSDGIDRLKREARILATLVHPNIATIFGVEDVDGGYALVMELVDGETLEHRFARRSGRALPLAEALVIARQIAEALDAAHEKGIVHRDLKPGNLMVSDTGTVKVLDFGIAKVQTDAALAHGDATLQAPMTEVGAVLGTGPYMSPEQARGLSPDKRTDIWAFGCVLYELLTGLRAFRGATPQDVLAAILEREPDWSALPRTTPAGVERLLRRCLDKDPRRRMRDIGDVRVELEDLTSPPANVAATAGGARRFAWGALAGSALGVAAVGFGLWQGFDRDAVGAPSSVARWIIQTPPQAPLAQPGGSFTRFGHGSLSPDGSRVVYVAALPNGVTQLYLRAFDERSVRPIAGTEGGVAPFFSPDGASIGFFADGSLKRVPSSGGPVTTISALTGQTVGQMGAWGKDGSIVFSVAVGARDGLFRVSDAGGVPQPLTHPPSEGGSHVDPWLIDDAQAVLFAEQFVAKPSIRVWSAQTGEHRSLIEGTFERPMYVPTGHLVYLSRTTLMAVQFDAVRLEVIGEPVPVLSDVWSSALSFAATNGRLAYSVPPRGFGRVVWVTRDGAVKELLTARPEFARPRLSPAEDRLALEANHESGTDIAWLRFDNGNVSQLMRANANSPSWAPDGERLIFRLGDAILSWPVGSATEPEPLVTPADLDANGGGRLAPGEWADPSTYVFVRQGNSSTAADIWVLRSGDGARRFEPLVVGPGNQWGVRTSPDGRFMSYASEEFGRFEIYVQPIEPGVRGEKISTDGGWQAVWSRDGRELFYRSGDRMMVVPVTTSPTFRAGAPRELFRGSFASTDLANYDVTRDGQRFVMIQPSDEAEQRTIQIVDHWFEELTRLVPPSTAQAR